MHCIYLGNIETMFLMKNDNAEDLVARLNRGLIIVECLCGVGGEASDRIVWKTERLKMVNHD